MAIISERQNNFTNISEADVGTQFNSVDRARVPVGGLERGRDCQARTSARTGSVTGGGTVVGQGMAHDLDTEIYFAHPYASWQCGLNDNNNGLIREYFSENCDLTTGTYIEIEQAMNKLNHRPEISLGFRMPYEGFLKANPLLTVARQS